MDDDRKFFNRIWMRITDDNEPHGCNSIFSSKINPVKIGMLIRTRDNKYRFQSSHTEYVHLKNKRWDDQDSAWDEIREIWNDKNLWDYASEER